MGKETRMTDEQEKELQTRSERELRYLMSKLADCVDGLDKFQGLMGTQERAAVAALARRLLGRQHAAAGCEKLEAINGTVQPCRPRPDGSGCVWCGKPV